AQNNRANARANSRASYTFVNDPAPLFEPLTRELVAEPADGCVVMVLASEEGAGPNPVWIEGVGWATDAPSLESRTWGRAAATQKAAEGAYRRAGVGPDDVDLVEVDDRFAYRQLQNLDAMGLRG